MYPAIPDLDYFALLIRDDDSIPLLEAAASLALDECPGLDLQQTLSAVDALSESLSHRCRGVSTEVQRLERALQFFYETAGFGGNTDDYYDPANSYLHRVIETRRGIPITLAVLFAELARGIGLEVEGVGFPGHFLVRVDLHAGMVVIDPFTGTSLDREELDRRCAPYGLSAQRLLQPASSRQILIRMLNNLHEIHARRGREDLQAKVQSRLRLLLETPPS